jgi:hypothetical protein
MPARRRDVIPFHFHSEVSETYTKIVETELICPLRNLFVSRFY